MFFQLSTVPLAAVLVAIVGGAASVGTVIGRRIPAKPGASQESVGVSQATLLGLVGLLLAFGLTMAVGRYDNRRAVLSLYLALLGRSLLTSLVAATVVVLTVFISFDLDRPQRGLVRVPKARSSRPGPR
jgi:hypothetical protein